jgi:hypothetical protein
VDRIESPEQDRSCDSSFAEASAGMNSLKTSRYISVVIGLLFATLPAFAHHNGANTYMMGTPVKWEGTVTFVSWDGPHVMYQIDVKNADGGVESWQVLGGSPQRLAKRGIYKQTVKAGDAITVAGYLDIGSRIVTPIYIVPNAGNKLFVGYVGNDEPVKLPQTN